MGVLSGIEDIIRDSVVAAIHSFSRPSGFHSVNEAELLVLRLASSKPPDWVFLTSLLREGDSFCTIGWAWFFIASWHLVNISEEEMDQAIKLNTSFVHIKRSANEVANSLAKERVGRPDMVIEIFAVYILVAAVFCFRDLTISSSVF